jgi:hypothetical protein
MKKNSCKVSVAIVFTIPIFALLLILVQMIVLAGDTANSEFAQEIEEGTHVIELIDGDGNPVVDPQVVFGLVTVSPMSQESSATMGISGNLDPLEDLIIYIGNGTTNPEWTVNLNAVNAIDGVWTSGLNSYNYKNNLTVDLSNVFVDPLPGCSGLGFSSLPGGTFEDSSPINLLNTTDLADPICAWHVTGIDLEQLIPGGTPSGEYRLDMQLTMN